MRCTASLRVCLCTTALSISAQAPGLDVHGLAPLCSDTCPPWVRVA